MPKLSFAQDIRPMFREIDIQEMKPIVNYNLSKYEDVCANAAAIYEHIEDGSMPCDQPWPAGQIAKFKQWMDEGMKA